MDAGEPCRCHRLRAALTNHIDRKEGRKPSTWPIRLLQSYTRESCERSADQSSPGEGMKSNDRSIKSKQTFRPTHAVLETEHPDHQPIRSMYSHMSDGLASQSKRRSKLVVVRPLFLVFVSIIKPLETGREAFIISCFFSLPHLPNEVSLLLVDQKPHHPPIRRLPAKTPSLLDKKKITVLRPNTKKKNANDEHRPLGSKTQTGRIESKSSETN